MKPSLVIIGLGNVGDSYESTRHNAGFWALDVLSAAYGQGPWKNQGKFAADTQEARIGVVPVLLVKPTTYMNLSGEAAQKLVTFYKLNPAEQVLVISDDIDLPLAELRLRMNGGPGTHNGMKSMVEHLGEGFPRLRIGLGRPEKHEDLANWVLSNPKREERAAIDEALKGLPPMMEEFVMKESKAS